MSEKKAIAQLKLKRAQSFVLIAVDPDGSFFIAEEGMSIEDMQLSKTDEDVSEIGPRDPTEGQA